MTIALFVIAVVVSLPIVAVVIVSVAIRREESAWSLGDPARGGVQAAARSILDFHSEQPVWPLPKSLAQARQASHAVPSAGQPRRRVVADPSGEGVASAVSIRPAA